jgi:glycerophosphoryl diester phosphodiesterase
MTAPWPPSSASGLPAATDTGDRLTVDANGAAAWQPPVSPPSALDLPPYGVRIFHRGAGDFAEDDSLRAIRVANGIYKGAWDVMDGGDWRLNGSGSVVSMHDSTTDRTCTTNLTVATATDAQWRALQLRARTPAQPTAEAPPFAADVLDYCKQLGLICAPELKVTGSSSFNSQVLALIQARGMEKQVILGSQLLGDLAAFKAAGVPTMYIVDTTSDTQANVLAAAPDFFCYNANRPGTNVTDAMIQALYAAGIRVGIWLADSAQDLAAIVAHLDSLGVPLQHYYTNAAPWASRTNVPPPRTRDPFSAGLFWPGMVQGAPYNSFGLFTKLSRGSFVGSPYRFSLPDPDQGSFVLQGWMTPATSPGSSITLDITFDNIGSNTARWAGIAFNCPTDRLLWNETTANNRGDGYLVLLRPTGSLELYRLAGDGLVSVNPTSGAAIQATAAIVSGQKVTLKIEPNLAANQIRVTRTDAGGFPAILATDATWRGVGSDPRSPYVWFGKRVTAGENLQVSFSNVVVVP